MFRIRYNGRKKCLPKRGRHEPVSGKSTRRFFRSDHRYGSYILLLLAVLSVTGIVQAAEHSSEPTDRDLQCMIYVTPDFKLLPLSAFSPEEGLAVYEWMCSGHLVGLIPRGSGYEATIRSDDGTLETRYFSEFSNGQPFCTPAPGCREWAYSLNEEEIEHARQFYGQEMSWLDLIREVAPDEYEDMDYITRAEASSRTVVWPSDPEEFVAPWTLGFGHCSIQSHISQPDDDYLLPDLSNEPLGRRSVEGPGWKIEIVIQEPKDQDQRSYDSMAEYYRVQHPLVYASLSPEEQQRLESQPARVGYVNIETSLNQEQQEVVRAIWGTTLTNKEYYTLLWPDLWNALPKWQKESEWPDEPYRWREPDPEHQTIPNDYILPEDRLPSISTVELSNLPKTAPNVVLTDETSREPDLSLKKTQNVESSNKISLIHSIMQNISLVSTRIGAVGMGESGIQDVGSGTDVFPQISERFAVNTAMKPARSLADPQRADTYKDSLFTGSTKQVLIENRIGTFTIGEKRVMDASSYAREKSGCIEGSLP